MITHLPTFLLIIGYFLFWLELFFFKGVLGRTALVASALYLIFVVIFVYQSRRQLLSFFSDFKKWMFSKRSFGSRLLLASGVLLGLTIIVVAFLASLGVPHLPQEYDALNYHITLPRQHLLQHSFAHIDWSSADLFLLPLDFALAPFWLVGNCPNKFPQFLFVIGLILILARLASRGSKNPWLSRGLVLAAFLGSHGFNIQMGTAMLDLVIAYLFFAGLDSLLSNRPILAAIEFSFYICSKPFIPLQMSFIIFAVALLYIIFKLVGISNTTWSFRNCFLTTPIKEYRRTIKRCFLTMILSCIVVSGPFVVKSFVYAGTPLYPFAPGLLKTNQEIQNETEHWKSLKEAARVHQSAKDNYGRGRGLLAFFEHFWFVAVPENNVNNSYDYPLGLPFLLFLGPFVWLLVKTLKQGSFPILPMVSVMFWLSWWFGSQQSRFLYIPLALMFVTVASSWSWPVGAVRVSLWFSLTFSLLSIFRANQHSFFVDWSKYARQKDKHLIEMNQQFKKTQENKLIKLTYPDVAYAGFPVSVIKSQLPFVVKRKEVKYNENLQSATFLEDKAM